MRHVSLEDDGPYRHDTTRSWTRGPEGQPIRLPTPDPSRSSVEAHENGDRMSNVSKESALRIRLDPPHILDGRFRRSSTSQNETGWQVAPRSPPYEVSEEQRPLLPSLKMILGDNITSPPRTPRTRTIHRHPIPREPSYTADTYKPPSLYPNKRQKLETLENGPAFPPATFLTSPSRALDSPMRITQPPSATSSTSSPQFNPSVSCRQSAQRPQSFTITRSPPGIIHRTQPQPYNDPSPFHTHVPYSSQQQRGSKQLPSSYSSAEVAQSSNYDARSYPTGARRFSASLHEDVRCPPLRLQYNQTRDQNDRSYPSPSNEDTGGVNAIGQPAQVGCDMFPQGQKFINGSMQHSRPPNSFAPATYDYCCTRARKRSNLPKHSTEIMRTWFDQNIGNPYPSEDQKAVFANATGISLTQVSNWFINHRRRCPELRDKRVERRKT